MDSTTAKQADLLEDYIAIQQALNGEPQFQQATFTGNLSNAGSATVAALDTLGGMVKNLHIKVWISGATAGLGITPGFYITSFGALLTFVQQTVPSLGAQHALAAAAVEDYSVGDVPEGLSVELRIASNGNDIALTYEATVTYEQ